MEVVANCLTYRAVMVVLQHASIAHTAMVSPLD